MNINLSNPAFLLFVLQRMSGAILALLLFVHIIVIIYAVQGGLTVEEITSRVRGNVFWIAFYSVFVLIAIVHAAIGLRKIFTELLPVSRRVVDLGVASYIAGALWLGYHAIEAIW